jgi:selenocysteine-specific elongation factor
VSEGLPREEAREQLRARADGAVFDAVLQRLVGAGTVAARDRLALVTHRVALSAEEEEALERLSTALLEAALRPPDSAALAARLGLSASALERALTLLQRRKVLVKVDTLWFHVDALERLKEEIRALKQAAGQARVDVAAFKDRYGVTRKFAIPLLEYLDRERVTRRIGDARVVL